MLTHDLVDFMKTATRQMAEEYTRIQKRAKEDPGTAGDQGEENWATLLRGWLPHTFHVVTKGRILSHKGIASPQIDILVLSPEYPPHLLDKKLYLAGGVIAAFECKTTLKSEHIIAFIKNSIEIKSHLPNRHGTLRKELQSRIIYGLLAHSHSWNGNKSNPLENIKNRLLDSDESFITHPIQTPDIICIADLATWSNHKSVGRRLEPAKNIDTNNITVAYNALASTSYMRFSIAENSNEYFTPIGCMFKELFVKLAWEIPSLRDLAEYFIYAPLDGGGSGYTRNWDSSIFSAELSNKIASGFLKNGGWNWWDEWKMSL